MAKKTPLQVMQRRATAKVRRLRAKGASDVALASTPVLPWKEVQRLSPAQRGGYFQKLKSFTSNRSHVLPTGAVIRETELRRVRADIRGALYKGNLLAQREAARIDAIRVPKVPGVDSFTTISQRQREKTVVNTATGKRYYQRGTVYGMLTDVSMDEEPPNKAAAARRAELAAARLYTKFAERRGRLRESVIEMLLRIGDEETADLVRYLSDAAFDVLTQRSTFVDELAVAYAPAAGSKSSGRSVKDTARELERSETAVKGNYLDLVEAVLSV